MPKVSKGKKFYAVQKGRQVGVFLTWEDCEKQTKGYPGAKYKSFANAADAEAFVSGNLSKDPGSSAPSTSSSSVLAALNSKGKKRAFPSDVADESGYDVVYCDGACKGNGQAGSVAGVGVWWEENDPRNIAERCPGAQTNNRAELIAIVRMLETTPKSKRPLLIKTDSQYCIKCFLQWLPKWKRNNFQTAEGYPVKNVEIIIYVSALLEARALVGQPVRMEYVKGHSGDRGNDGADAQANKGALLSPMPERDWTKAKQELLERLEEERRLSEGQPTTMPLGANFGVPELSMNQPRKVRKVSHDTPFSKLSPAPTSTELSNSEPLSRDPLVAQVQSPSPPRVASPHPPHSIVEVSSSPPQDNGPPQTQTTPSRPAASDNVHAEPEPVNAEVVTDMNSQLSKGEPNKPHRAPKTPVRKHGVGLFTTTPPPNAKIVRKFSTLPRKKGDQESKSVLQDQENNEGPKTMYVANVDLSEATKSEPVSQDQEANEQPVVMSAGAAVVNLIEVTKSESVAQDQREHEKPPAMIAADVVEPTQSESPLKDQEINKKPGMNEDAADEGVIETKESTSVPDQEETKESMAINEDATDVGLKVEEATEPEVVPVDQDGTEKSMTINKDAVDVSLEEAKGSEPVLNDQGKTEKPMIMSLGAADVELTGVTESGSVTKNQENPEKSLTISLETTKVDSTGPTESELATKDQRKIETSTEKPLAMSVDASDVNLNGNRDVAADGTSESAATAPAPPKALTAAGKTHPHKNGHKHQHKYQHSSRVLGDVLFERELDSHHRNGQGQRGADFAAGHHEDGCKHCHSSRDFNDELFERESDHHRHHSHGQGQREANFAAGREDGRGHPHFSRDFDHGLFEREEDHHSHHSHHSGHGQGQREAIFAAGRHEDGRNHRHLSRDFNDELFEREVYRHSHHRHGQSQREANSSAGREDGRRHRHFSREVDHYSHHHGQGQREANSAAGREDGRRHRHFSRELDHHRHGQGQREANFAAGRQHRHLSCDLNNELFEREVDHHNHYSHGQGQREADFLASASASPHENCRKSHHKHHPNARAFEDRVEVRNFLTGLVGGLAQKDKRDSLELDAHDFEINGLD